MATEISTKNDELREELDAARKLQEELAKEIQEEKDYANKSIWNFIPIAGFIHQVNMTG